MNNLEALERAIHDAGIELLFDESGNPAGIVVRDAKVDLKRLGP